jgi:Abortive infection C-terminus
MNASMKIEERTLKALGQIVTGDAQLSPYRTGPMLVDLFNDLGLDEVYGQGFPSRWAFAEESIRKLNGKPELCLLIERVFDPREFLNTTFKIEKALEFFNQYLSYENYQVAIINGYAKVRDRSGIDVEFVHPFKNPEDDAHLFIDDQVKKCDDKIASGDYYGAITNARSLLEAVLIEIEHELDSSVAKLMNLGPERKEVSDTLKQILSGLNSIVSGLAGLRNKMSDAHVATYKPSKHHAKLAVNAAKTVSDFLLESKQYQKRRSKECS